MSHSLRSHEPQDARPPCPSPTPGVHPNPCVSSRWCHPTISSSVIPFSSCPQSFPASQSFQIRQLLASGGHSIVFSASTSVLPMNTQDQSPLAWTGLISLQSKGLSRVFSNTTVQKHRFFGAQLSWQIRLVVLIPQALTEWSKNPKKIDGERKVHSICFVHFWPFSLKECWVPLGIGRSA